MTAISAPPDAARPGLASVGKYWWLALVVGVLTTLAGIVALLYPGPTLLAVGLIIGIYLTFTGTVNIFRGIAGEPGASAVGRVALVIVGLLAVLAGLVLIVRPGQSVLAAAWAIGFWWVLVGIVQLVSGIADPDDRGLNIGLGLLGIVAGAAILGQPDIGLVTLVWIVAIGLLVQGAMEIVAGLQIRKLHNEGEL